MMPTPPLAYHDPGFLDSDEGRPVRILSEYLAPLRAFNAAGVTATVVFFGSARVRAGGPRGRYVGEAMELARLVTEWSRSLAGERLIVCSGGGPGIMEAANRGAALAGGRSVGLNIGLPQEQRPNPYITPELGFEFHYFFMRKLWFAHLARALVAFPGGFGTFDELFEILTLAQTHKLERSIPVFLYGSAFWKEVVNFEALVRHGTIAAEDLELFEFVDEPRSAFELIKSRAQLAPQPKPPLWFAKSRRHRHACGPLRDRQRRIDLGVPAEQASLQVRGRGHSGTQRQLAGCEAAAATAADEHRGVVRRNLRQAPWQLAQRDVDGTFEVSGAEFMHLAHVDQARRRRACVAQQLVQGAGRDPAHSAGYGGGGLRGRVAGLGDRGRGAADRAVGAARDAKFLEAHLERVVGQQPSGERIAHAGNQLDRFGRLQSAQHTGQHAQNARLCAVGYHALGCLREHAPVARPPAGHVSHDLAFEAVNRGGHQRQAENDAGVVDEIAGGQA